MATIPTPVLRHWRKTIALDGGATSGQLGGDVPAFALTGSGVSIHFWALRCTENLACSAAADTRLVLRSAAGDGEIFSAIPNGSAGQIWDADDGAWASMSGSRATRISDVADDLVLSVVNEGAGADITDGTVVIDLWGFPITDDGALTGDDASPASGMLGEAIEGAHTVEDLLRIIAAAVAGKVSGAEGNAPVFRDLNDTKDRIIAATTADGNRTAVSHDPS